MAAQVGDSAYGVITADDSTEFSMSMMSLNGAFEVTDVTDGKVTVDFPLKAFEYTRGGITGVGYLAEMTVDGTTYKATGFSSRPSDGDTGSIEVVFDEDGFDAAMEDINTLNSYLEAHVQASIKIASVIPMNIGKDVHVYFSETPVTYVEKGIYNPAE